MKEIQGYLCIVPNNPDGRGLLYFTEVEASREKIRFDESVKTKWETDYFNKEYWKEKPSPCEIYPLTCCKNTTNSKSC
jgi:hypothetical protein